MSKQLGLLSLCNLLIFSVANGLLPLLPVYATDLGASAAMVGVYMGFAYAVLAAGTLLTGWLAQQVGSPRRLFVLMTLAAMVAVLGMGQVNALWQLVLLTAVLWFCGGIVVALIYIFTGLLAGKTNRGRTFGILFLGQPAGALLGGALTGRLADYQGYAFLFGVLSLAWLAVALLGAFGLADRRITPPDGRARSTQPHAQHMSPAFHLLLIAVLLAAVASFIGRLGTSLLMSARDFSTGAITETTAIGGLVVIPLVLVLGSLSDRMNRRGLLSLCVLAGGAGLLVLGGASTLPHFWSAAILFSLSNYVGSSVAAALATDLLQPETLSKGLSRLNAMNWIGGIIGFSSAGTLAGHANLYAASAILAFVAVLLLWLHGLWPGAAQTPAPPRARVEA